MTVNDMKLRTSVAVSWNLYIAASYKLAVLCQLYTTPHMHYNYSKCMQSLVAWTIFKQYLYDI